MLSKSVGPLFSFVCFAVLALTAFLHGGLNLEEQSYFFAEESQSDQSDGNGDAASYLRTITEQEDKIMATVENLAKKLKALENDRLSDATTSSTTTNRVLSETGALPTTTSTSSDSNANNDLLDTCQRVQASSTSTHMFMPYGAGCPHHPMTHNPKPLSISTIIPSLARQNFLKLFPTVLKSIQRQTVPPDEVVIAISGLFEYLHIRYAHRLPTLEEFPPQAIVNAEKFCQDTFNEFTKIYTKSPIKLICIGERLTAGRARMIAVRSSSSDILGCVDADDQEISIRNEVIRNAFGPECSKDGERMLLIHSARQRKIHEYEQARNYIKPSMNKFIGDGSNATCVFDEENLTALNGLVLYRRVLAHKNGWRVAEGVAYGHPVVRRKAFDMAMYATISNGEDALFMRDLIQQLGPNAGASMYLNRPLTTYFTPGHGNKDIIPQEVKKN